MNPTKTAEFRRRNRETVRAMTDDNIIRHAYSRLHTLRTSDSVHKDQLAAFAGECNELRRRGLYQDETLIRSFAWTALKAKVIAWRPSEWGSMVPLPMHPRYDIMSGKIVLREHRNCAGA
jgi:hypothetical protein